MSRCMVCSNKIAPSTRELLTPGLAISIQPRTGMDEVEHLLAGGVPVFGYPYAARALGVLPPL